MTAERPTLRTTALRRIFPVVPVSPAWAWAWRLPAAPLLRLLTGAMLAALALPVVAVVGFAVFGDSSAAFLSPPALAHILLQTALYVGGVLGLSLLFALPAAWATVMFSFRGRDLAAWMLLLPFALPPYLTAYAGADMLRAAGLVFPALATACVTTALAVYPYVYFLVRAALRRQHCHIQSAARLLGCSPAAAFWRVSLPLARPAIGVGIALAAMETLNDIAVAEYFGLQTLGAGVYDLWLNRGDIVGAARLAVFLLAAVFLLVWSEERSRRRQAQYTAACDRCYECERAPVASGGKLAVVWLLLLLPPLAGFFLPLAWLVWLSSQTTAAAWADSLLAGLSGSLLLSCSLSALLLICGAVYALDKRYNKRGILFHLPRRLALVTYALPGTMLAQGWFLLAAASAVLFGGDGFAIGGLALLLAACASRFFVIAGGTLESAIDAVPPRLDAATKLAAVRPLRAFFAVYLPLLRPSLVLAAVMVFLEGIKELPMTLLLRPFNFETLSVVVYQYASDESLAPAAPAALALAALAAAAVSLLFVFEGRNFRDKR